MAKKSFNCPNKALTCAVSIPSGFIFFGFLAGFGGGIGWLVDWVLEYFNFKNIFIS